MALIRILVKEGLTGLYYIKNGADSRKSSLIDPTQDKMAILAILWPNMAKYGFNITIFGEDNFASQFYVKRGGNSRKKQSC